MGKYQRLILLAALLLVAFLVFELTGLREEFSLPFLRGVLQEYRFTGVLIFTVLFSVGNLVQLPGWIFLASAILALGTFWGGVATYIAGSVSCLVTFLVVRAVGGSALEEIDKPLARRILAGLHRHPVRSVLVLRLIFQTMPALNYTLALSGVSLRHYMVGTVLGLPLPLLVYCLFFDRLAKVLQLT